MYFITPHWFQQHRKTMKCNTQFQNVGQEMKLYQGKKRCLGKGEFPSNLYFLGTATLLLKLLCGPSPLVDSNRQEIPKKEVWKWRSKSDSVPHNSLFGVPELLRSYACPPSPKQTLNQSESCRRRAVPGRRQWRDCWATADSEQGGGGFKIKNTVRNPELLAPLPGTWKGQCKSRTRKLKLHEFYDKFALGF